MTDTSPLRLMAEDAADLEIISAAVQDSVTKAANLKFERRRHRFSLELNRFRWEEAVENPRQRERVRALLAIDGVLGARARGLTRSDPELVISLLRVEFRPGEEPPGGQVVLTFAGDGEIVLDVEVLDVTLLDSDYVWPTRHVPNHEKRRR
ncbi:MAG: DUF2948 family protein [Alphaproteobacteria bacterium]|jgi:hypothetical protein|nr:DUF2948 family protein [Alphaproteobacteria bacterium]